MRRSSAICAALVGLALALSAAEASTPAALTNKLVDLISKVGAGTSVPLQQLHSGGAGGRHNRAHDAHSVTPGAWQGQGTQEHGGGCFGRSVEHARAHHSSLHTHELAPQKKYDDFVKELSTEGMDVNQPDSKGRLPLAEAVRTRDVKYVDALIQFGALANSRDPATKASPVQFAFQNGLVEVRPTTWRCRTRCPRPPYMQRRHPTS